jgi:hypothetical protein
MPGTLQRFVQLHVIVDQISPLRTTATVPSSLKTGCWPVATSMMARRRIHSEMCGSVAGSVRPAMTQALRHQCERCSIVRSGEPAMPLIVDRSPSRKNRQHDLPGRCRAS